MRMIKVMKREIEGMKERKMKLRGSQTRQKRRSSQYSFNVKTQRTHPDVPDLHVVDDIQSPSCCRRVQYPEF
ncbi:hypothetical protein Y032_1332g3831 [Ancylostoma ceylanicum]|uniref:Uncharacterized protein n=1 Tax=Ancylostoma ceylanicum TaxID=53326 RepID=A0A016W6D1_9BILA|nr:hypothetical protein Y032_1332g3831 [Ancylostoma ceylanicum]